MHPGRTTTVATTLGVGRKLRPPTARGICGSDIPDIPAHEFLDLLCALVDKSILIRTEHHGVVDFRLLETLRDYGNTRIADAEHTQSAQRHAGWYHQLLTDAEAQWFGPQQPPGSTA